MSKEQRIQKLQKDVSAVKLSVEKTLESIRALQKAVAGPYFNAEISWKEYNDLNGPATRGFEAIEEQKLTEKLDELLKLASFQSGTPLVAISASLGEYTDILEVLKQLGIPLNTLFEKPLPIVAVHDPETGEVRTSKTVDNLLHTYTPFKLRGVEGNYSILLLPSLRGDNITGSWYGGEIYSFDSDGKRVLTPDEIRPVSLRDIKNPISVTGEFPFRLEIDKKSAVESYYCLQGYYISYKSTCQYRGCPLWGPCGGKKFWRGPKPFQAISKVSPDIQVKVDKYEFLSAVLSTKEDEIRVERIDELTGKVYIDSVLFLSPKMLTTPVIRTKETIGYRVRTKSLAFSFREDWVRKTVTSLLQTNRPLFNWILMKWFISTNFDVNDVRSGVTTFFWNLIQGNSTDKKVADLRKALQSMQVTPELLSFGVNVLLHSIAHLLHEEVTIRLQTDGGNFMYTYWPDPDPKDNRFRIFLFENAEKGLGLTESFSERAGSAGPGLIGDMLSSILDEQILCVESQLRTGEIDPQDTDVGVIRGRLDDYKRAMESMSLYAPVELVRYILTGLDPSTKAILEKPEFTTYVDDLLSLYPSCWDGCYNCVRLETDCHQTPYEQMYAVSKLLLVAAINTWRKELGYLPERRIQFQLGQASNIMTLLKDATSSLQVITPWMSKEVAEILVELTRKNNISVRVITTEDAQIETHVKAVGIIKSSLSARLDARILKERRLHAKMVIIDGTLLVMGSANLTLSGLFENVENYVVIDDNQIVEKSKSQFEDLWKKSSKL